MEDYFDQHAATREAAGSKGGALYRNVENPNELFIVFEWDDLANARKFAESADLREAMQKAGVTGRPNIHFVEKIEAMNK
jgi:heme-degrading monooxygenase HmoA